MNVQNTVVGKSLAQINPMAEDGSAYVCWRCARIEAVFFLTENCLEHFVMLSWIETWPLMFLHFIHFIARKNRVSAVETASHRPTCAMTHQIRKRPCFFQQKCWRWHRCLGE